jgi:branched-chain amino acid transport system substrate-binding protein
MKKLGWLLPLLLGSSVMVDVACSSDAKTTTTAPSDGGTNEGGADTIVIGVNLALTGNLGPFGQAEQDATSVADRQINAAGGVLGRRVVFKILDDTTTDAKSKEVMQELINLKVPIILGPTGSPQAVAVHQMAMDAKIALISPSASTPVMTTAQPAKDRYFFRTAASHALQAQALAIRAFRGTSGTTACKKVALIQADDAYGNPIGAGFTEKLTKLGGTVVLTLKVPTTGRANYDAEAQSVATAGADCQVLITFPDVAIQYLRDFKKRIKDDQTRNWSTFVSLGSNGLKSDKGFLVAGREDQANPQSPTIGEGMYVMNLDLNPDTTQYREFKNLFLAEFTLPEGQTELDGYTANQYDAAVLAALAIQQAGTVTDGAAIRDALFKVSSGGTAFSPARVGDALVAIRNGQDVDYVGASGPVDFDDHGDVLTSFVVFKIENGAFKPLPAETIKVDDLK